MGRIQLDRSFEHIISTDNLLEAWREFSRDKRSRKDVQEFGRNLMDNVLSLRRDLVSGTYRHSSYEAFNISDPKPRNIHKATVRDRLLHHALYRQLYPFFDKTFTSDSYSCRRGKGMHRAIERFRVFSNKVSRNNTRTVWVLKCDIRKFFASIDHTILKKIIVSYIPDTDIIGLLALIIDSFSTVHDVGLPLGNLTSQLLVNVYMNQFDQFVKHKLKAKYYIRYSDDFVVLSEDREWLEDILSRIRDFLADDLRLALHPDKVSISTMASGVDFLGWVHFPDYRVLRTTTKRRMFQGIRRTNGKEATVQSYLGLMSHGNTRKLRQAVLSIVEEINPSRSGVG